MSAGDIIGGGEEILPTQQHEFIDRIVALKPLLGDPALVNSALLNVADETGDNSSVVMANTVGKFRLDTGWFARIRIVETIAAAAETDEDTGGDQPENDVTESWMLRVPRAAERVGEMSMRSVDIYKVERWKMDGKEVYFPEHEKQVYKQDAGSRAWEKVPNGAVQEIMRINALRAAGEIDHDEAADLKQKAREDREEFERTMGQFSLRFTVDHFNDAIEVLDQLGPHNRVD